MAATVVRISIKNFRSLAKVSDLELGPISVLFGPNGSGKSTFLDSIWFVRDCAIRGVAEASSNRSHGIGVLFDGAAEGEESVEIALSTGAVRYTLTFDLADGRINPFAGEQLKSHDKLLIERRAGSESARLYHDAVNQLVSIDSLREPEKLTLSTYLNFNPNDHAAGDLDQLLHFVRYYHSRSFALHPLKTRGSESSYHTHLFDRAQNLWSALRNIKDKSELDDRWATITRFMSRTFPDFLGVVLEQTGPNAVYGSFREKGRKNPIAASGVSDGHLQMLVLLTSLFSEGPNRSSLLLFDEPEISLHPWAIAVLAEAMEEAASEWDKQILVATHSPVLMSQFEPAQTFAAIVNDGQTSLERVSEVAAVQDLLEDFGVGTLYMSEALARQSSEDEMTVGN